MKTIRAVAAALLLALPVSAAAQQKGVIDITTEATVDVVQKNEKGEKAVVRKPVSEAKVVPGEVVTFTLRYFNKGKQPATGVIITNPVPEHMTYVDKSAEGKANIIEFSVDNGISYAPPDKLKIKDDRGKLRPAKAEDYTHIRWVIGKPVAPKKTGTVSFKARVK